MSRKSFDIKTFSTGENQTCECTFYTRIHVRVLKPANTNKLEYKKEPYLPDVFMQIKSDKTFGQLQFSRLFCPLQVCFSNHTTTVITQVIKCLFHTQQYNGQSIA